MKVKSALFLGVLAALAMPSAAQAQVLVDTIGQAVGNSVNRRHQAWRDSCIAGEVAPPSPREVSAAAASAEETMRAYLARAGASAPADVTAIFVRRPFRPAWEAEGQGAALAGISDPLAHMVSGGTATIGPATSFFRSIDGESALGIWQAVSPGAGRLGYYRAIFMRERRMFRLAKLEVFQGAAEPEAIHQYCFHIGDIEQNRASEAWHAENDPKARPDWEQ